MKIIVYDAGYENFYPITYTRPVFDLKLGNVTFLGQIKREFSEFEIAIITREYLAKYMKEKNREEPVNDEKFFDDDILFIDGRVVVTGRLKRRILEEIERKKESLVFIDHEGEIVVAYLRERLLRDHAKSLIAGKFDFRRACEKTVKIKALVIKYPWELIANLEQILKEILAKEGGGRILGEVEPGAKIVGSMIYIGENSLVESGARIISDKGPVYIDSGVIVENGSRIEGPIYIGSKTFILSNTRVAVSAIGSVCRIGGEIERCLIQGYSNKYHLGFLGHSYVGEWVNIGAGTTNSDLKNTYGTIRTTIGERIIDTGEIKYGCLIGDFVKTSIGTYIYAGKKIGIASHTHGYILEDVPSFTIWAKSFGVEPVELEIDSVIRTQERMMMRRGIKMVNADKKLMKYLFELTLPERKKKGVKRRKIKFS